MTYVIAAHDGTTGWRDHIHEITEWTPWIYSAEEIEKAEKRKRALPKVELGMFEMPAHWNHFAVVTNFNLFHNSLQSVMEFYCKRGNAENFIREDEVPGGKDLNRRLKYIPTQGGRAPQNTPRDLPMSTLRSLHSSERL